jgi:opacity protein-like surface antigen
VKEALHKTKKSIDIKFFVLGIVMRYCFFIVVSLIASSAYAQDYWSFGVEAAKANYSSYQFVNPRITGVVQDNNTPSVNNLNIAYGRTYPNFRGELELTLGQKASFTSYHTPYSSYAQTKEVTSNRLMANVFKDFELGNSIKPFVGAGLGLAYNTAEGFQGTSRSPFAAKSTFSVAYGASAGARYSLDKSSGLTFSYQYINAGKADTGISQFSPYDEQYKGNFITSGFKFAYTKSL